MAAPHASVLSPAPSAWSLERRLPLLILGLLACVIGLFSAAAYLEVRTSAIERAADRLERFSRELTASSARGSQARFAVLRTLAADSALVAAVLTADPHGSAGSDAPAAVQVRADRRSSSAASARVASVLRAAHRPADSTVLGWELWRLDGGRPFASGPAAGAGDSTALAVARASLSAATDSIHRSALTATEGGIHMWTLVPVRTGGRTVGLLAERRRMANSAQSEQMIRRMIGEDVDVLIADRESRTWASLRGVPVAAPFAEVVREDTVTLVTRADGTPHYVVQSRIPGTSWRIVLLQSKTSVLRRPQQTLRNLLGVGVALLALSTIAAWLLGRHVARPLRRVTDAAAALAGGDYAQRVPVTGRGEVAGLATAFNAMASGLGDAHAALEERNMALQRANEAKGQFLAIMSHELRTPLNAIGGYTELLQLGLRGPVTPAQVDDLIRIRRSKDHLLAVISDILTFARAEAGVLPLTIVVVGLAELFRDAVDMLGPQFETKRVRLEVAPVPADACVRGDREKVQQVVLNLLSNALKFTEPGGEVRLGCTIDEDRARISVRDTGIGIAPERLGDIFEPFVQVDGSLTRRVGGAGLGLAIARNLTTAMGGTLSVESALGGGSCFTAALPRADGGEVPPSGAAVRERTAAAVG